MLNVLHEENLGSACEGNVSFHLCTYALQIKLPRAVSYIFPYVERMSNKGSLWVPACICSQSVGFADEGTSAALHELRSSLLF